MFLNCPLGWLSTVVGVLSIQWRRLFLHASFKLQINKDKLLIDSFSLFPCLCASMMFESLEEIKHIESINLHCIYIYDCIDIYDQCRVASREATSRHGCFFLTLTLKSPTVFVWTRINFEFFFFFWGLKKQGRSRTL